MPVAGLSDNLGGTFDVPTSGRLRGYRCQPVAPLGAGASYDGLSVALRLRIKFGQKRKKLDLIRRMKTDWFLCAIGADHAEHRRHDRPPTMIYSYAYGDVHIITYNGTHYNFQAEGEFTLAKAIIPNDTSNSASPAGAEPDLVCHVDHTGGGIGRNGPYYFRSKPRRN